MSKILLINQKLIKMHGLFTLPDKYNNDAIRTLMISLEVH